VPKEANHYSLIACWFPPVTWHTVSGGEETGKCGACEVQLIHNSVLTAYAVDDPFGHFAFMAREDRPTRSRPGDERSEGDSARKPRSPGDNALQQPSSRPPALRDPFLMSFSLYCCPHDKPTHSRDQCRLLSSHWVGQGGCFKRREKEGIVCLIA